MLPSDIIDPEHDEMDGIQRFLFDLEITNQATKHQNEQSKNIKGGGQQSTRDRIMNERRGW